MLDVEIGGASVAGRRPQNEDFYGAVTPEGEQLALKGMMFAVADGVSGNEGGREAAEQTVRTLLSDYYATPDTWEVTRAVDKVLCATNRWLLAQDFSRKARAGMACTLTSVVFRGARFTIGHVGDSRAYRYRQGRLEQLTTDHVWDRPDMHHILKRAVGLDEQLLVDFSDGELQVGDIFLLVTDGVWEPLGDKRIHEILHLRTDVQRAADALVQTAVAQGGQDNATAVVIRVKGVPEHHLRELIAEARDYPIPPKLKPGQMLDEFEIIEVLHESRATLLYKARQSGTGREVVLKTLPLSMEDDPRSWDALLTEEWLGKKLLSSHFSQVIPLVPGQRNYLYYALAYYHGATLQQHIDRQRHFSVSEAASFGILLLKAVAALHRLNILHRDIKPANLHWGQDGQLRLLDLGVACSTAFSEAPVGLVGTPSYMAPELYGGSAASPRSDLYSAGVTLYYLLTRKYPYGEIEPFQHPRFGDPVPPTRYRPEIPEWLESVLLKATARNPEQRFETAEEFLLALERGEYSPLFVPRRTPLAERNPALLWQAVGASSIVLNLLLLYLLIAS